MKNVSLLSACCRQLILVTCVLLQVGAVQAQDVLYDDQIKVETFSVEGSDVDGFRVEAVIDAPVSVVMAVIRDVDQYPRWMHSCSEAELIESSDFYRFSAYQVSSMPWPVSDRDMALVFNMVENDDGGFHIKFHSRPGDVPETKHVRIVTAEGYYHFTPLEEGKTRYISRQHFEPAGDIPNWLVNQLLTDIPLKSVEGLRKMVQKEEYSSLAFERDEEGRILGWKDREDSGSLNLVNLHRMRGLPHPVQRRPSY